MGKDRKTKLENILGSNNYRYFFLFTGLVYKYLLKILKKKIKD